MICLFFFQIVIYFVQKFKREGFDWYVRMVEDYQAIWQRSVSSLGDNLTRTESQKLRAKREAAKIGNRRPRANSRNIATSLAKYVTGERRSESRDSRDSISEEAIKVTKGGDDDDWDLVDYQDQSLAQERASIPETPTSRISVKSLPRLSLCPQNGRGWVVLRNPLVAQEWGVLVDSQISKRRSMLCTT
jgi:hypothetical protein